MYSTSLYTVLVFNTINLAILKVHFSNCLKFSYIKSKFLNLPCYNTLVWSGSVFASVLIRMLENVDNLQLVGRHSCFPHQYFYGD